MDPITQQTALASAGGKKDPVYVDDVFSTFLYDGNEGSNQINNGIDLAGEGGLVWFKNRTRSGDAPTLIDTETQSGGYLISSGASGEAALSGTQPFSSFNSNGYTINSGSFYVNDSSHSYASWTFRKAPGFFDVVTYNGSTGAQSIAHNLGSAPGMIIIKCTSHSSNWRVYHRSEGATKYAGLNTSDYFDYSPALWNDTAPTSTHFTVNTSTTVNGSGRTFVAYLFAHDDAQYGTNSNESIIKCGSFTGGGTLSNPKFIDIGFEAQFVLWKRTDAISQGDWYMNDSMRGMARSFSNQPQLQANNTDAEGSSYGFWAYQNGFAFSEDLGGTSANFVYMAIRRPNKPPEAATEVFAIDTRGGTSPTPPTYYSGFPVDWFLGRETAANDWTVRTRLTGNKTLSTAYNSAETSSTSTYYTFDQSKGLGENTNVSSTHHGWMFKRAPGFMDVVTYSGNSTNRTLPHNLESTPEMMIVKCRSDVEHWRVYAAPLGATKALALNLNSEAITVSTYWNNTAPTSSVFSVGTDNEVNGSTKTYVAWLFATLPGISKIGSYSGTGNDINVDCGFGAAGARFVLIKCNDYIFNPSVPTSWFVWDSTRGIVSGNDPYIVLDTDAAQVTNTDYIDPLSSGFTVTSSAPPALNASGNTYTFLAIA